MFTVLEEGENGGEKMKKLKKGDRVLVEATIVEHICADAWLLEIPFEPEPGTNKFVASAVCDIKEKCE